MKDTKERNKAEFALVAQERVRQKKWERPKIPVADLLIRALGFLAARAVPLPGLAPFGLAFLAMDRKFSVFNLFSMFMVVCGYASLFDGFALRYIGACLVYETVLFFLDRSEELSLRAAMVIASAGTVIFHLVGLLWTGLSGGEVLLILLDFALTGLGVLVLDRSRNLMNVKSLVSRVPSDEEKLSLCIAAGIALLSFQGIPEMPWFSAANILGFYVLGLISVAGGILTGAVGGLGIGLLLGLQGDLLSCLAIFGASGLVCGFCSRFHKYAAAAALAVSGAFLSFYSLTAGMPPIRYLEPVLGAMLLAAMPDMVFCQVRRFTNFGTVPVEADNPYKNHVQTKLALAADSFRTLSQTFVRLSDKQDQVDMQDIASLFDTAADRVCRSCTRVENCWNKNFNATYKTMFKFLEIMERKGCLNPEDVDPYFSERCLRLNPLIREVNRLFEVYKINQVWKRKLCENRELVGEQFSGVAEILTRLSRELDRETSMNQLAAEEIRCRLENKGVALKSVRVVQSLDGRQTVQLEIRDAENTDIDGIPGVLKSVLGTNFSMYPPSPKPERGKTKTLQFTEAPALQMEAAFACAEKSGECGDSHMLNLLHGGKYIATLSDGMGTGHRASRESSAIVSLLEDFMDAGFDKTVAVKLINSVMVMKSANEAFATVDMCMVDLYTGEAEFIKNGAEPSYIKRFGGTEIVRSASLPVGILSGVEIETFAHKLGPGDTVVMVSDGLEVRQGCDGWLRQAIDQTPPDAPVQELADWIMAQSVALKGGTADDDMTVIVLRLSAAA